MKRWQHWIVTGIIALALCLALSPVVAGPAWAQDPDPDDGDDEDGDGGVLTIIKSVFHTMFFPIESMTAALKQTITNILSGVVEDAAAPFADGLEGVIFGGVAGGPGEEMYGPAWRAFRNISVVLWPLTLGLIVVAAARGGVGGNAVGFADLKEGLIEWASAAVLTVASAYLIGLGMRLSRGISTLIMGQVWGTVSARTLVGVFFNTGLVAVLIEVVPGAAIFFILFMLILGFSMCTALIFAYVARYAALFILVSISPLVITLGVVRELRWLFWMWLKGITLMLLLGPANALLLKLAHVAAVSGLGEISSLFGGVVKLLAAGAVLSVLLTIDYAVVKGIFGAIGEIASKATAATLQVVAGIVALAGVVLSGGLAGLGIGAAAAGGAGAVAAGGAAAGAGGGGAAATAAAAGGEGAVAAGGGSAAAETGAAATQAALEDPGFLRRMSSMLRTAGQATMSSRSPIGRALSGAARGVGGALGDRGRRIESGQREAQRQARMGERDEQRKAELGKARAQAQERAHHRGWQGLLDANGISSAEEGFMDMGRVLSRLEDEYGGQAVRQVAPEVVQGMRAAQQYGGISLLAQAQAAGHASPAEYLGSQVEGRLQAHEGVRRPPIFPPGVSPSPGAWGAGPGPYDYRVGMDLAGTLGRRGAEAVDAYARLAWAVRDPALGAGREAIDHLYGIAGTGWDVGAGEEQSPDYAGVVWPHFGREVAGYAHSLGLAGDQLPSAWLREQAFLQRARGKRAP